MLESLCTFILPFAIFWESNSRSFARPWFVTGPELAGAVSEAGGLGLMSFSRNPPELLRRDIAVMRAHTGLPFGVNMLLTADVSEQVAVCCEERVPILSFFWGTPLLL